MKHIRLKIPGELFWATQYPDLALDPSGHVVILGVLGILAAFWATPTHNGA